MIRKISILFFVINFFINNNYSIGQDVKVSQKVCPDTLKMSDFILSQKDTVFFNIPDTGFYKNAFIEWDEFPRFPGDEKGLIKYINENTNYPYSAINDSIEGRVILRFIIDLDGCPRDIKVVRGLRDDLNNECIRVLKEMPKWKPGTTIRKAEKGWYRTFTRVYYNVPFNFSLSKNQIPKGIIIYP